MSKPVIVIGAGGHAAVVADALLGVGTRVLGFTDPDAARRASLLCGLPVLGDDSVLRAHAPDQVLLANGVGGLGDEGEPLRRRLQQRLEGEGWQFCPVIHAAAVVSPFAVLDGAVQVLAGAVVQAGARLGSGCVINTGAIVEHDCVIGAWSQLGPGAVVCGAASVGAGSHVGAGAIVRQGLVLGEGTRVGAGAVVVKHFSGSGLLIGVPARPMEL